MCVWKNYILFPISLQYLIFFKSKTLITALVIPKYFFNAFPFVYKIIYFSSRHNINSLHLNIEASRPKKKYSLHETNQLRIMLH